MTNSYKNTFRLQDHSFRLDCLCFFSTLPSGFHGQFSLWTAPRRVRERRKQTHLPQLLQELKGVFTKGTNIVSTHNGLGTEDCIAGEFGADAALRMSLNYGVSTPCYATMANLVRAMEDKYRAR